MKSGFSDSRIQAHVSLSYISVWDTALEKGASVFMDFIFLGSKITGDGDCSHEIKRQLLLESKAMTKLDSIVKSRDITLTTKVHLVKLWFFQ